MKISRTERNGDYTPDMTEWNERYRVGDTPWDKGMAAPPLLEFIEKLGSEIWGDGEVLVPGCGLGYDARALAKNGVKAVGLDISGIAIQRANGFGVEENVRYELGDFLDPLWRVGRSFKGIWEHTCFCAIDPSQRKHYAQAVIELIDIGGLLAGVFFLTPNDPSDDESVPPFGTSLEELEGWFSPEFERIDGWVPEQTFPGREGREWIGVFRKVSNGSVALETGSL
jgi:SAM-dependent methyltransferase